MILLLGILSVFALGRLFDQNQFAARGFFDDTVAAVRFAQKFALSSGCDVQVSLSEDGYVVNQRATSCGVGSFTRAVANPANRANPYRNGKVAGLAVSEVVITFDARGLPVTADDIPADDISVTMTGPGVNYNFTVFAETGLVQ